MIILKMMHVPTGSDTGNCREVYSTNIDSRELWGLFPLCTGLQYPVKAGGVQSALFLPTITQDQTLGTLLFTTFGLSEVRSTHALVELKVQLNEFLIHT